MTTDRQSDEPSALETVSVWFTPGRFASVLALLVFVTFAEVIVGSSAFITKDFSQFGYGLAHHHRESFWNGEIPLWNPLSECGIPFLAQWNTMVLYPGSLFYVLLPLDWSLSVFCVLHLYLGGLGAYFLARRHTGNNLAGAIAGLIFAFNGFTQACLMWPNNIAALGWLPWVFLTAIPAWREGGRRIPVAALVGALQMLTGAPEIILCTWLLVFGYLAWDWFQSGAAARKDWQPILRLAGVVGFIVLLTAAQLIPFLDLLRHSQRQAEATYADWSISGLAWIRLLMPLFHTRWSTLGMYEHLDQGWIHSYYVGGVAIVFSGIALIAGRRRSARWMGMVVLFAVTLAMGRNFLVYPMLEKMLPLGFIRYPVKFLTFALALVPFLSAVGLHELLRAKDAESRRRVIIGAMIGGVFTVTAFLLIGSHPVEHNDLASTRANGLERLMFLVLIAGAVVGLLWSREMRSARLATVAVLVLLWMDFTRFQTGLWLPVNREIYSLPLPALASVNEEFRRGETRYGLLTETQYNSNFTRGRSAEHVQVDAWLAQFMNLNLLGGVKKFDGFFALWFPNQNQLEHVLHTWKARELRPGLADFLAIAYTPTPGDPEKWTQRPTAHKIVTAGQLPVFESPTNCLRRLEQPDFDSAAVVSLPIAADYAVRVRERVDAKVTIERLDAHEVVFTVDAPANTLAVIAQCQYHPWRAEVDGMTKPIYVANHAFQAVPISAGQRRVTLRYVDRGFQLGVAVSLSGLALLGLLWWRWRPVSARPEPSNDGSDGN